MYLLLLPCAVIQLEVDSLMGDSDLNISVTREQFESLNEPLFKRCIDTVKEVLADAKVSIDEVRHLYAL